MGEGERQQDESPQALEAAALEPFDAHGDEAHAVLGHDAAFDLAPRPDVGQRDLRRQGHELPPDDEGGIEMAPGPAAADDDPGLPHIRTVPPLSPRFWLMWSSRPIAASVQIREDRP